MIPEGTWMGPYQGTLVLPSDVTSEVDTSYMWEVRNFQISSRMLCMYFKASKSQAPVFPCIYFGLSQSRDFDFLSLAQKRLSLSFSSERRK